MTQHSIAELEPRGPRDAPREMPIAFGDRSLLSFARRFFLVTHCGESLRGEYLHTLSAVDVATGWCELEVLPNRSQQAVTEALELMRARLPFPLLGIDSDNDSAFINANLLRCCQQEGITFTRCRPGKNDQAHVEQKNWTAVRKLLGYDRYETGEARALLQAIYADWRVVVNFFQPVRKLLVKNRVGSKVLKRYDVARTPYQRVLASSDVSDEEKESWEKASGRSTRWSFSAESRRMWIGLGFF